MEQFYDIRFINHNNNNNITCQFLGNTTLSQMITKYCNKIGDTRQIWKDYFNCI